MPELPANRAPLVAVIVCPTCGMKTVARYYGPCEVCRIGMRERAVGFGVRNKIAAAVRKAADDKRAAEERREVLEARARAAAERRKRAKEKREGKGSS